MTPPATHLLLAMTAVACISSRVSVEARRVVIFPVPLVSLAKYQTNMACALTRRGHEVWMTLPDHIAAKGVLDTANITVIEYHNEVNLEEALSTLVIDRYMQGLPQDRPGYLQLVKKYIHGQLTNNSLFQEMRKVRPDFVILDSVPFYKGMVILPYRLRVPFGFVGFSFADTLSMRVPVAPSVTPYIFAGPYTEHMTFTERLHNTLHYMRNAFFDPTVEEGAVQQYAPEMPDIPIDMLVARAEIWLLDTDHIMDYPRPSLPNVKLVGGLAAVPGKPLQGDFKSFMDNATEGVAVVSFGSFILDLPSRLTDKLFNVLQRLPMKSVIRSSRKFRDPSKVMTSSWLPQNDLLAHPNAKVFISHCGNNGQHEALYHAVPIVCLPLVMDEPYNAVRMRRKGFGETLDLHAVTEAELRRIIVEVATSPRYKAAISRASELFRIEFGVPQETAAFWIDHVINYGGAHMRSAGQDIPLYQFLSLDVYAFVTVVIHLAVFASCTGVCLVWKCVTRTKKPKID